jgi:DMSO/TMAO reductase YedYZ molybdopterin-dependent catalytic subunit
MGILDDWFKAKKEQKARAESKNPGAPAGDPRIPPGQVKTEKWPVLHTGMVPHAAQSFDPAAWDLRVFGEVDRPLILSWAEFNALPRITDRSDFHCVTRWSRLDNTWEGVSLAEIMTRARVRKSARHVIFHGELGYTANITIEDARAPGVLLATHHDGAPLTPEHGGPLRSIVPHLYAWKSAKWLRGIEFSNVDKPGYWEVRGYSNTADPFKEQRYSDD